MEPELQTALEHHRSGRVAEAEQLYRQILARTPTHAGALHFLGVLAHQVGRQEEAIELMQAAHRHGGADARSWNSLGLAYLAAGKAAEGKRCFGKALALKADYAEAHSNLGAALRDLGRIKDAEQSYRRAVALLPQAPEVHYNLGNLLASANKLDAAMQSYRRAIDLAPAYAPAHNNLGHVLWRQGRLEEARASCQAAVSIDARYAEAYHNLGKILEDLGRAEDAENAYRAALAIQPDQPETRLNLGNLLQAAGQWADAERCYRAILAVHPGLAVAHYNLANCLARLDRHEEALAAYRSVIELDPAFAPARWMFAAAQLPAIYADAEEEARCREHFSQELDRLAQWVAGQRGLGPETISQQPFHIAYVEENNRDLMARYGALCARVMGTTPAQPRSAGGGRIRVGIVSAQIRQHSVWDALVRGWVRYMDPERFELQLFHLGARQDEETTLARQHAARFEQGPRRLGDWVDTIRSAGPDVLIYPEVAMDMTTVRLAGMRLAAVQATSWGHPETSGLPTMDYYLSGALFEPEGAQDHYTERLVRLSNFGCFYEARPVASQPIDLAVLGIEADSPLFVCPGTPFKYAPRHDGVLTALARRVPQARFVFFTHRIPALTEKLRRRLEAVFEAEHLEFEQHVTFLPWLSAPQFYGLMTRADVFLDTIGFSGFNTALQAIECGLPVVTREGRFLRGRLASALLKRMDVTELIAASDQEYVDLAAKLALDPAYRAALRMRMAASRALLYEDREALRSLEAFLAEVGRR